MEEIKIQDLESLQNIDKYPDGSISINAGNLLDQIEYGNRKTVLQKLCSKIKYGGTLFLNGHDVIYLGNAIYLGISSISKTNEIIANIKSLDSYINTVDNMKLFGLHIENGQLFCDEGCGLYKITGKRNG